MIQCADADALRIARTGEFQNLGHVRSARTLSQRNEGVLYSDGKMLPVPESKHLNHFDFDLGVGFGSAPRGARE
jgi:hypothetical protein